MNQKQIFSALIIVSVLFVIYLMQDSFKQYKAQAANKDIEKFYSDLNERYIGEYFQIQQDLQQIFSNHQLSKQQKERLLFTQDSLRIEFGKSMKGK
jgi:uncharacterized protein (UPF0333 family)